ncbi:hypothetical protein [Streptomyces sp. NPDC017202]|uniref:hypothetical protein n=1 Tax=Streptomyces sp. NPDC017202 TaxID=3364981 RepID=UPI00378F8412
MYDGDADDTSEPLPGTTNSKIIPGRPANVTTPSCLRSAADALLSLPGAPAAPVGLKSAATDLLDAVDAVLALGIAASGALAGRDDTVPGAGTLAAAGAAATAAPCTLAGPPALTSAGAAGVEEVWERVRAAAEALREKLARPGGYHRGRAAVVAERLMGVKLGAAQEEALGVWGELYGKTSGTLHGAAGGRAARACTPRSSRAVRRTPAAGPRASASPRLRGWVLSSCQVRG